MAYRSLRDFLDRLETEGELVRVAEPVSTVLEMTEIQTRLLGRGRAGGDLRKADPRRRRKSRPIPVLVNLFGTVKRVARGVTLGGKERQSRRNCARSARCSPSCASPSRRQDLKDALDLSAAGRAK